MFGYYYRQAFLQNKLSRKFKKLFDIEKEKRIIARSLIQFIAKAIKIMRSS